MECLTVSEEYFIARFKPQKNHFKDDANWDGCMYEAFGEDLAYVQQMAKENPKCVWTVLDCDGRTVVGDGFHFVNRMGYIITKLPCPDDAFIEVIDPCYQEDEEE